MKGRLINGPSNCLSSPTQLISELGIWLPLTCSHVLSSDSRMPCVLYCPVFSFARLPCFKLQITAPLPRRGVPETTMKLKISVGWARNASIFLCRQSGAGDGSLLPSFPKVFAKQLIFFQRQTLQHGHGSPHSPPLPGLAGLPSSVIPPSFNRSGLHPDPLPSCRRRGLRSSVGVCLPPRACPMPPTPPDGEGEGGGGMGKGGERGCRAISALSPRNWSAGSCSDPPSYRQRGEDWGRVESTSGGDGGRKCHRRRRKPLGRPASSNCCSSVTTLGPGCKPFDLHPSIVVMVESWGEVGRRVGEDLHGFIARRGGARALLPLILLSRPSMQEGSYSRPNPIQDF